MKNNIFISVLVTIIIILVICIFTLVFISTGKDKITAPDSSDNSSQSSEESSQSSEPEESSSSSSEPEESSSEISDEEPNIRKEQTLEITSGNNEYKDIIVEKDVIINSSDKTAIYLENVFIDGNLIIDKCYSNIYLNNVDVGGNIIINNFSGYEFALTDTIADELRLVSVLGEYFPIISIEGKTQMNKALIYRGAILRQKNLDKEYKGFTHIGIGGYKPRLWHDITLENVTNCYLTINFPANVNLSGNTNILQTFAYKQSHIYGPGSIQYLFIKSDGVSYDKVTGFVSNPDKYFIEKGGKLINRETLDSIKPKPSVPQASEKPSKKPEDNIIKPDLPKE